MALGPYDQATQWLLDQMHDPKMPIWHRIEIAKFLIESRPEEFRGPRRDFTTIIIEGTVPNAPVNITLTIPGQSPFRADADTLPAKDPAPLRLN
jgi:hypothetical protein